MGSVTILYIAGASFSGSTFLGAALAQHPDLYLTGELIGFLTRSRSHKCSCGKVYRDCSFWTEVISRWEEKSSISWDEFKRLSTKYERWRSIPRLLWPPTRRSAEFQIYAAASHLFLETLSIVSGKTILIDISKYPSRALALHLAGVHIIFVHLVKNGLAYLDSNTRRLYQRNYAQRPMWPLWRFWIHSALEWNATNILASIIGKKMPKSLRLRYEEYITEPDKAFARIGKALGRDDLEIYGQKLKEGTEIYFGHAMGGNLIRLKGKAKLEARQDWKARITPLQRLIYQILSAPLNNFYKR